MKKLRVVILKPSKYGLDGFVERFRRGFMPNGTIPYLRSMTPGRVDGIPVETEIVDEYVQTDLAFLRQLRKRDRIPTLLALAGVQSHQFQRALDLAAYALDNGVEHCVIGGPHAMTCDTSLFHGRGVSFAVAEAELVWPAILSDAVAGGLRPVYGEGGRWRDEIDAPVLVPPPSEFSRRYVIPMIGIYPARGCPFSCNFCSVIKIAGRTIRSQSIEVTLAGLRAAKAAGVRMVMFTSDNFNKYPDAAQLLQAMIDDRIQIPFFVQCDTQIVRQEPLVDLLGRAGCFQMFVGVESFNRKALLAARKTQNRPELYGEIVRLARNHGIGTHFSNIIGFPEDTEAGIRDHLDVLLDLSPDMASFYILTPIPGTEQYDEFLADGRIRETNLDRFDGTHPTWRHGQLSDSDLTRLVFHCYDRFYSMPRLLFDRSWATGECAVFLEGFGAYLFSRFASFRKRHPMSGGIGRVRRDHADDYHRLRRRRFGVGQVPLPRSLPVVPSG